MADAALNIHFCVHKLQLPCFSTFKEDFFCSPVTSGPEVGCIYHTGAGQSVGFAISNWLQGGRCWLKFRRAFTWEIRGFKTFFFIYCFLSLRVTSRSSARTEWSTAITLIQNDSEATGMSVFSSPCQNFNFCKFLTVLYF